MELVNKARISHSSCGQLNVNRESHKVKNTIKGSARTIQTYHLLTAPHDIDRMDLMIIHVYPPFLPRATEFYVECEC